MKNVMLFAVVCFVITLSSPWNSVCFGVVPAFQNKTIESGEQYFYVRENGISLRRSPGDRARTIARVDSGAVCRGIYHIGEWVQVKFDTGYEGFIHQSQLSPHSPGPEMPAQSGQSLITNLIDDSIKSVLAEQSKKVRETSAKITLWIWLTILSIVSVIGLIALLLKEIIGKKKAHKDYVNFKELATIQKSRESLQEEVDLLRRTNKNLEKKILQLEEKLKKE